MVCFQVIYSIFREMHSKFSKELNIHRIHVLGRFHKERDEIILSQECSSLSTVHPAEEEVPCIP